MAVFDSGNGAPAVVNGEVAEVLVERREREERETKCKNGEEEASLQSDTRPLPIGNPLVN